MGHSKLETEMKVKKSDAYRTGTYCTGKLVGLTASQISKVIGFEPDTNFSDPKTTINWGFLANGQYCSIWNWKGSNEWGQWSVFGPSAVFEQLFQDNFWEELAPSKVDLDRANNAAE